MIADIIEVGGSSKLTPASDALPVLFYNPSGFKGLLEAKWIPRAART